MLAKLDHHRDRSASLVPLFIHTNMCIMSFWPQRCENMGERQQGKNHREHLVLLFYDVDGYIRLMPILVCEILSEAIHSFYTAIVFPYLSYSFMDIISLSLHIWWYNIMYSGNKTLFLNLTFLYNSAYLSYRHTIRNLVAFCQFFMNIKIYWLSSIEWPWKLI